MSQGFRLRFDEMRESDPTGTSPAGDAGSLAPSGELDHYAQAGQMRNVCFVWPDGRRLFLSYSYLVSAQLGASEGMQQIRLGFTSHTLVLTGLRLLPLYAALMEQRALHVRETELRYAEIGEEETEGPLVSAIALEAKP